MINNSLVIDDLYASPSYKNIRATYNKQHLDFSPEPRLAPISLLVHSLPNGNLTGFTLDGIYHTFESMEKLFSLLFWHRESTIICYEPMELDILLKPLGRFPCTLLVSNRQIYVNEFTIKYKVGREITITNTDGDMVRVQSIKSWFGISSLENACNNFGLPCEPKWQALTLLGHELYLACSSLGFNLPNILYSPSGILSKIFNPPLRKLNLRRIPPKVFEAAYGSLHAPWVEMLQMGKFNNLYQYDLNSAYPYEASKLLDITKGVWKFSSQYEPTAEYGFCRARVNINPNVQVSPIFLRKAGGLYSVTGEWITHITKDEIDFIHKQEIGTAKVLSGWWFFPRTDRRPFLSSMNALYYSRSDSPVVLSAVLKAISVRLSGKFLERYKSNCLDFSDDMSAGRFFNPIYANIMMTRTKLKVAEAALSDPSAVVAILTDALITSKKLDIKTDNTGFGEFKLVTESKAGHVFSPQEMYYAHKLSGTGLRNLFEEDPEKTNYLIHHKAYNNMCRCIQTDKFNEVGQIFTQPLNINTMGMQNARDWDAIAMTGGSLLNGRFTSKPMNVDVLAFKLRRYDRYSDFFKETIIEEAHMEEL